MSGEDLDFLDGVDDEDDNEILEVESEVQNTPQESHSQENSLVKPAADVDDVVEVYDQFEQMKSDLLDDGDTTKISGNIHINKSGWRKYATAFNLSVKVVSEERVVDDGIVRWKIRAEATAPNGKSATGEAIAASNESNYMERLGDNRNSMPSLPDVDEEDILWIDGAWRRLKPPREVNEHNIYATAATRAKNRAISDCVGGGEVSAEEITAEDVL